MGLSQTKAMVDGSTEDERKTKYFILSIFICVFAGSFQYGYNISSVNGVAEFVKDRLYPYNGTEQVLLNGNALKCFNIEECDECINANCTMGYDEVSLVHFKNHQSVQDSSFAFQVGIFAVGGIIGSFLTKVLTTKFGRKGSQAINMFISIAGAANFIGAYQYSSPACFTVARILLGIFSGFATGVCPMYIIELASKKDRGWIGVLNQLMITIGILVGQIVALPSIMGKADLWGWYFSLTAVPAVLWLISYPFTAESPRYTLIELKKEPEARDTLVKLRGTDNVRAEMSDMQDEADRAALEEQLSLPQVLSEKSIRWQLVSICLMMLCQQLSGINAVFFYTNAIFEAAGFDLKTQLKISVLIGAENVAMTVVSMSLMEKLGRKKLMLYGYGIMIFFCFAMVAVLNQLDSAPWVPYLSIVCVMGYIFGFAIGPGPIPWIWNTEFFKQSARAGGATISCVICWVCTFLVGQYFPAAQSAIGEYVFVFFGGICVFAFCWVWFITPETKGRTFLEIENCFAKLNGVPLQRTAGDDEEKIPLDQRQDGTLE